tara:strand:+ start:650 stop:856 length:207 start_codon:yes stop_codon:yes gene_type:complete
MIDAVLGFAAVVGAIVVAFFAGKRRREDEYEIDAHNEYVATRKRIEAATRPDLSDADVDDSLRRHAKR